MNAPTQLLLMDARHRLEYGLSADLPGAVIEAWHLRTELSPGYCWSARDMLVRVCFPGESSERGDVTLARWCARKSKAEMLAALDAALAISRTAGKHQEAA
jgi:hypothetical protein